MAVEQITNLISEQTFGIWFLIGAALVFLDAGRICNGRNRLHKS